MEEFRIRHMSPPNDEPEGWVWAEQSRIIETEEEIDRLTRELEEARLLLLQVRENVRSVDLMGARDSNGEFLNLDSRIDAAISKEKP